MKYQEDGSGAVSFSGSYLPVIGTVTWFTVLKGIAYTDWFHLAKYYSSTAGCIFFWCFRYVKGTRKDGTTWELKNNKIFMLLIPAILAINIFEACSRDFQVAMQYWAISQNSPMSRACSYLADHGIL